jgi:hypothetical protein
MDTANARRISQLAVLMTAGLPALAGMLIFRSQPILVAAIQGEPGKLGLLTDLFYNHAGACLIALLAAGVVLAGLSFAQLRKEDDADRLATQLALLCAAALLGVLHATLFVLAAALPLYARLTAS